jgi:hypothetical protein
MISLCGNEKLQLLQVIADPPGQAESQVVARHGPASSASSRSKSSAREAMKV